MQKNKQFLIAKAALVLATVPAIIHGWSVGPEPSVTGAPGDATCLQSGCHQGTANTGGGSVKVTVNGGLTSYTPGGPAIPVSVLITDASMRSYGFEMSARSGTAGTTEAGDFTTTDANTQVICADDSTKANGKTCPAKAPVEDIEHSYTGWGNSINKNGSFTYNFMWTPPATNVGNVTFYIAANCGTGADAVTPTHVYLNSSTVLAPAAPTGPAIANVQDAASARTSVVPGEWVAIYGSNMAGTSRTWAAADFNGNNLPTNLSGVTVSFGTLPAPVFYISPTQIDVQAPSGISGTVPVTVSYGGSTSAGFTTTVSQSAPTFFTYPSGSNTFAAAQNFPSYSTVGDPAVTPGTAKATAGQTVILYLNGLAASPSGTLISPAINYSGSVSVTLGSTSPQVTYSGLVAAGLYQVNITIPIGLAAGTYPISLSSGGQTTQSGVSLIVGP
jgi:uncharacterized protein (TIGR03437 family)